MKNSDHIADAQRYALELEDRYPGNRSLTAAIARDLKRFWRRLKLGFGNAVMIILKWGR